MITSPQRAKDVYTGTTWVVAGLFSTYYPCHSQNSSEGISCSKGQESKTHRSWTTSTEILCEGVSPWDIGVIAGVRLHVFPPHVGRGATARLAVVTTWIRVEVHHMTNSSGSYFRNHCCGMKNPLHKSSSQPFSCQPVLSARGTALRSKR